MFSVKGLLKPNPSNPAQSLREPLKPKPPFHLIPKNPIHPVVSREGPRNRKQRQLHQDRALGFLEHVSILESCLQGPGPNSSGGFRSLGFKV